jgi:hypothetical protein
MLLRKGSLPNIILDRPDLRYRSLYQAEVIERMSPFNLRGLSAFD